MELRASQRFLVEELERRGIAVDFLDREEQAVLAHLGGHMEPLVDVLGSGASATAIHTAADKQLAKVLMSAGGLSVPEGQAFADPAEGAAFAATLKGSVVVKPRRGVGGEGVTMDLTRPAQVAAAAQDLGPFLVEAQFDAAEFRIFVTSSGDFAVLARKPAFVVGDGARTIRELAEHETFRRMNPRKNCLGPIVLDNAVSTYLAQSGLTEASVPAEGAKVTLRSNSNVTSGGTAEDVTAHVHPEAIQLASRALACFPGLPFAGIDFMTADIRKAPTSYRVLEVNPLPGIGMHHAPSAGRSRNVARVICDLLFPETATPREPGPIQ